MRLAALVGKPAEGLLAALPDRAQKLVASATNSALDRALGWAVQTLPGTAAGEGMRLRGARFHTTLTAATGAIGGMFGLAGAALEVPTTTVLMLRSIAAIARDNGFDPADPDIRLQCLSVFSLGSPRLDTMESAYFSSRIALALAMRDASRYVATHGVEEIGSAVARHAAPALLRFVQQVAARFEIVVTEKLAAQAVPIAGAALGSLVNAAFTDHFNRVAAYHFGIVRLERQHGQEIVRASYQQACAEVKHGAEAAS